MQGWWMAYTVREYMREYIHKYVVLLLCMKKSLELPFSLFYFEVTCERCKSKGEGKDIDRDTSQRKSVIVSHVWCKQTRARNAHVHGIMQRAVTWTPDHK
jgi:hypothetical protein